jgi:hypothetical protein
MHVREGCRLIPLSIIGPVAAAQCGGATALAPPVVIWSQFRVDVCHTGYNPYEFMLSPATVGNLVLRWKYTTGNYVYWGVHLTPVSTTGCGFAFVLLSHCLNPL